MTRTDVMASSRPQTAGSKAARRGSSSFLRVLSIASVALALVLALVPAVALASAEPTSGYTQTPTTTSTTTPSSGVAPSKEEVKPTTTAKETTPTSTSSTAPASEKATTLPFTGFDLRWEIGVGLLLILGGVSIVVLQRRQRSAGRR
jgi:hypothetical protein